MFFYVNTAFAVQLFCVGINTPNVRFIINNNIILSEKGSTKYFEKKRVVLFNFVKGIHEISANNKSIMEVEIDLIRGKAQIITTIYHSLLVKDVYVRDYVNCK